MSVKLASWRRRLAASLAIAAATVAVVIAPRLAWGEGLAPLAPLAGAAALWLGGLIAMMAGARRGLYAVLLGGFLFINFRFLSVLPGDDAGLWIVDYTVAILGYALSSYEAGVAWKTMKPASAF
jgi:hypothetical protein